MSSTGFMPNGLLSKNAALTTEQSSDHDASFVPNGLLHGAVAGSSTSYAPNGLLGGRIMQTDSSSSAGFQTNGLLSTSTMTLTNEFRPNGLLSSSVRDDEFPTFSQAYDIPHNDTHYVLEPHNPTMVNDTASTSSRYHVQAKTFNGKTFFLKKKLSIPKTNQSSQKMTNLLSVPIHRMLDRLSENAIKRLNSPMHVDRVPIMQQDTLWTDKYRPRQFVELTGNERVARETMLWVKEWDRCVFGIVNRSKGKKKKEEGEEEYIDEFHRPKERILLLSGPPGLGKTTLAHVVARQAGYEVMEINASDARSGQVIDDRVRPALESGSAVGHSKPVLLIIDEIDGATGAGDSSNTFIWKLLQLTKDQPRRKPRPGQKGNSQNKRPVLRPIICICNDVNASSLAKLRPLALQMRMQRPPDIHIARRLREVCDLEGLKADSRALATLVGLAKGDLRGCLNTLQFVKARNEEVTEPVIRKATVGMKEADSSLLSVLNDLFLPLSKRRVKELALSEEEEARYVSRLSREVDSYGKDNSVAIGCFAHYATLRQHDANFSRYMKAGEWLMTFDLLSAAMYSDGEFALAQYLPYTLVPFFPLFNERGGPKVERNSADWDNLQVTRTNEEIYRSIARCLQTASTRKGGDYRHLVSTPILQLELAPYINRIISPPLKPVNQQIIKPVEKAVLTRLVAIMATLELRFVQERGDDGQLTYRLDPAVDVFITYDGKRASDIAVSRYAVRHLVAGEVEQELATRHSDFVDKGKKGKHAGLSSKRKAGDEEFETPTKRLKYEDIADKPPVDFFGRPILIKPKSGIKPNSKAEKWKKAPTEKKLGLIYKFKEGNSAAVRKPVKVQAFL